jgi:hypothetical protein
MAVLDGEAQRVRQLTVIVNVKVVSRSHPIDKMAFALAVSTNIRSKRYVGAITQCFLEDIQGSVLSGP